MKRRNLLTSMVALSLMAKTASACLNDRDSDSLVQDNKGLPDTIWVIAGRFERNPPLYYEMRIARVKKEIAENPQLLPLYDDIAVAYDRLHDDDAAIAWMEKKGAQLERVAPKEDLSSPDYKEHWYRYHANIGTFYAHRWLKTKDRDHLGDMQKGHDHIARGLEIKPNAHFAREPYQLLAMKWILSGAKEPFGQYLMGYHEEKNVEKLQQLVELSKGTKIVEGVSGLIVLGAAWESVDMFTLLASALRRNRHHKVGYLAQLRVVELQKNGRQSLSGDETAINGKPAMNISAWSLTGRETLEAQYKMLRADAEAWHKERTDYMMARLKTGKHPDTHSDFWSEYKERPKPSLEVPWYQDMSSNFQNWLIGRGGFLIIPFTILVGLVSFKMARKVRNQMRGR
jgi:tetratricopeptide (TPR) repeat protein